MLIKDKIRTLKLSSSEKDIANYILNHTSEISSLSTRELAKKTFTSSAAIIRFSNKLGFDGYASLKKQLLDEISYIDSHFVNVDANIPFHQEDSIMKVTNSIAELAIESAKDTLSLLNHDDLQKTLTILNRSEHIYMYGFGAYVPLSKVFQLKMSRIHKHVIVQDHIGEEKYQADMIGEKDCAIVISYSGENHTLNNVILLLNERNIPVIGITSIGENTMAGLCTTTLRMSTREKLFSKIANYSSEHSVQLILDVLYSLMFHKKYNQNLEYKISHSKKTEFTHFSNNEIIQEEI